MLHRSTRFARLQQHANRSHKPLSQLTSPIINNINSKDKFVLTDDRCCQRNGYPPHIGRPTLSEFPEARRKTVRPWTAGTG